MRRQTPSVTDLRGAPARLQAKEGFNLVEILVAIVVLSVVVTMMASVFRDSQSAWTQGVGQNDVETGGRTVLSLLANDLRGAVADSTLTFRLRDDRYPATSASYGLTNSEVSFIAFQESPTETNRAARMIMYWVQPMPGAPGRYELVRACWPADAVFRNCYTNPSWFEDAGSGGFGRPVSPDAVATVTENVSGFGLTAPGGGREYSSEPFYCLPSHVDIYLELLSERDAKQAAALWARGLDCADLVERRARRFTTRVYFYNRDGFGLP